MLNKLIKIWSVVLILALCLNSFAFAESNVPSEVNEHAEFLKASLKDSDIAECGERLGQIFDIKTVEFFKFIEDHFKSKSNNSDLINVAVAKFGKYKKDLDATFDELKPQSEKIDAALSSYFKCEEIKDVYVKLAKEHMLRTIKTNNVQKKTTMLTEKYKSISGKLRKMNLALAQLKGNFKTFDNKLPGYLSQCVQK